VFEPDSPLTPEPKTQRLSTLYNADVGLYMLANKVMLLMCDCVLMRASILAILHNEMLYNIIDHPLDYQHHSCLAAHANYQG
jgi:CMP-N-acetylneuraminic acid synthetase